MAINISRYRKLVSCLRDVAAARFASLKRGSNDSGHGLNAQTYGIPFPFGGSFKNAYSNFCLACARSLSGPQRIPRIIQNGLQKLQGIGS
jgi:hypothetical protein